jgi:DNA-directed RNA polymerase subunit RPC12/RpoP
MAQQQDWFKCQNSKCGHEVMMKVLGNTATCSKCGSKMVRK